MLCYSVIASRQAVLDQLTGNWSFIGAIEALKIGVDTVGLADRGALVLPYDVLSYWDLGDAYEAINAEARMVVLDESDGAVFTSGPVAINTSHRTFRLRFHGLPVGSGPGRYRIYFEARSLPSGVWSRSAALWPVMVTYELPEDEPSGS